MKLFELVIENENVDEVFALSAVFNPAIELLGTYFNRDEVHFAEMNEQGLFMAPILIPNKKILRVDGKGEPYEVFLSTETVKRLSQMYLEKKYQDQVTVEHEKPVSGVTLVESWIKESITKDKSNHYNLNAPVGSWIGTFKIDNEEMREKFRKGELRGISIEGVFEHMERNFGSQSYLMKDIQDLTEDEAKDLLNTIHKMLMPTVEMESYSDYGEGIKNNAKRGIELNEKNGNKCATQTGKVRAQQLASGEPISVETIKRMHSYLSRAETYYDNADSTSDCGYISYLLWGGKAALGWSRNKLRELDLLEEGGLEDACWEGYVAIGTKTVNGKVVPNCVPKEENMEQPSVSSTYPGEVASGSISEATL